MSYGRITDKQREILEYIKKEILNRGYPPTVRDICEAVNLKSTSSVHSHLETLEKNGYIRRDPTKPRAIEIVDDNFNLTRREFANVPLIGQVAAGQPLLAVENIESYLVEKCDNVHNGDIVVALIDDSATVKTFYKEDGHIRLQPENDTMDPIIVPDCKIVGKVFGVFRFWKIRRLKILP